MAYHRGGSVGTYFTTRAVDLEVSKPRLEWTLKLYSTKLPQGKTFQYQMLILPFGGKLISYSS